MKIKARNLEGVTRGRIILLIVVVFLLSLFFLSLAIGKYYVPINEVFRIIISAILKFIGVEGIVARTWTNEEETVVLSLRLPRAVMATLVGASLSCSGAVLQSIFRNPLVSPDVIGVSSGASFGGVFAIIIGTGGLYLIGSSFIFGLSAVAVVMLLERLKSNSPILMIVLGGIVVAAFFNALVSFVTYIANPYTTLPSITFWLMGSLASITMDKVYLLLPLVVIGIFIIFLLRWRINILSLGDDDAISLGINPVRLRLILIVIVSALTAATVASVGVVGWVGLVIPHLARLLVGSNHRYLILLSFLTGSTYLLLIDLMARNITRNEIPIGTLTAVIGAPFFIYLLVSSKNREIFGV